MAFSQLVAPADSNCGDGDVGDATPGIVLPALLLELLTIRGSPIRRRASDGVLPVGGPMTASDKVVWREAGEVPEEGGGEGGGGDGDDSGTAGKAREGVGRAGSAGEGTVAGRKSGALTGAGGGRGEGGGGINPTTAAGDEAGGGGGEPPGSREPGGGVDVSEGGRGERDAPESDTSIAAGSADADTHALGGMSNGEKECIAGAAGAATGVSTAGWDCSRRTGGLSAAPNGDEGEGEDGGPSTSPPRPLPIPPPSPSPRATPPAVRCGRDGDHSGVTVVDEMADVSESTMEPAPRSGTASGGGGGGGGGGAPARSGPYGWASVERRVHCSLRRWRSRSP